MTYKVVRIAVDFDGVIHSFTSGWHGPYRIDDPPTEGAIAWLKCFIASPFVEVSIYSARSWYLFGNWRMKKWLHKHGLMITEIDKLKFWRRKPVADIILDDRCVQFTGEFPKLREMQEFEPWHKQSIFGDEK